MCPNTFHGQHSAKRYTGINGLYSRSETGFMEIGLKMFYESALA